MTGTVTMVWPGVMGAQRREANLPQEPRLLSKGLLNDCLWASGMTSAWCTAGREAKTALIRQRGREGSGKGQAERSQDPWVSDPV